MTTARFYITGNLFTGYDISGHSCAGEYGQDLVCSAVSAIVTYTECLINDVYLAGAAVNVNTKKACVSLMLKSLDETTGAVIKAMYLYFTQLQKEHPNNILVEVVEHA